MNDCLFCKIIRREIPAEIVFENNDVFAFLTIGPVSKGHTLLIPKNHANNLTEGTVKDAETLMRTVHDLAPRIVKALGGTAYNLGMNHGKDASQEVFHTHLHIIPRYENDAHHYTKMDPTQEELKMVADIIRNFLEA